jgi:hypothetical protein
VLLQLWVPEHSGLSTLLATGVQVPGVALHV